MSKESDDIKASLDSVGPDRYTEWPIWDLVDERERSEDDRKRWRNMGITGEGDTIMDACARRAKAKIRAVDVVLRMRGCDSVDDVYLYARIAQAMNQAGHEDDHE